MVKLNQFKLKTLNLKDTHFRLGFNAPRGRSDKEFENDIFSKINQIEKICIDNEVDLITIAGDVFDIKEASRYTIKQLSLLVKILTKLKEATKLKLILTIAGNHDLPNSSRAMKNKSVYWFFHKLELIQDIHHSELTYKLKNSTKVSFFGIDFTPKATQLHKEIRDYHDTIKPDTKHYRTLLMHEHLLPYRDINKKEAKHLGNKFTYSSILKKYPNIDVVIAGHYHFGYQTYNKNGRIIINNWNLTRLARNYYVLSGSHIPNVVLTTYTKNKVETADIDLDVRSYVDAINEEEIKEDEDSDISITEFIDRVNDSRIDKGIVSNIKLTPRQRVLLDRILEEAKDEVQE